MKIQLMFFLNNINPMSEDDATQWESADIWWALAGHYVYAK